MLAEAGLTADRAGFDAAMEEQRTRSRATARFRGVAEEQAYEVGDVPATRRSSGSSGLTVPARFLPCATATRRSRS